MTTPLGILYDDLVKSYIASMRDDAVQVCARGIIAPGPLALHIPRKHYWKSDDPLAHKPDLTDRCIEAIRAGADCIWTIKNAGDVDVSSIESLYDQHKNRFVRSHPLGNRWPPSFAPARSTCFTQDIYITSNRRKHLAASSSSSSRATKPSKQNANTSRS